MFNYCKNTQTLKQIEFLVQQNLQQNYVERFCRKQAEQADNNCRSVLSRWPSAFMGISALAIGRVGRLRPTHPCLLNGPNALKRCFKPLRCRACVHRQAHLTSPIHSIRSRLPALEGSLHAATFGETKGQNEGGCGFARLHLTLKLDNFNEVLSLEFLELLAAQIFTRTDPCRYSTGTSIPVRIDFLRWLTHCQSKTAWLISSTVT